jgi:hypothetical protein
MKVLDLSIHFAAGFFAPMDATEQFDRFFFICHSPKGMLNPPDDRPDVHVWTGRELGSTVMRLGLHDWVMEKIA